jgi:hypothetical protein
MKKVLFVAGAATLAVCALAPASAKDRKADVAPRTVEIERSMFSGGESQLYLFGMARPDCTIPIADIRIVKAAAHGDVRFEETKTVFTNEKNPLQKLCYGKTVDAVRALYKANDNFVGKDQFTVDVDPKSGKIWRYRFVVDVR